MSSRRRPRVTPERLALTNPYLLANERSRSQDEEKPEDLDGYLRWYITMWADEVPMQLHSEGSVAFDWLGSPRFSQSFRRYLEALDAGKREATADDADGYLIRPLHAALFKLAAGGGIYPSRLEWTETLLRLAYFGFDIEQLARHPFPRCPDCLKPYRQCGHSERSWPLWQAKTYVETALRQLYRCWRSAKRQPSADPPTRGIRGISDSQANAEAEVAHWQVCAGCLGYGLPRPVIVDGKTFCGPSCARRGVAWVKRHNAA